MCGIFGYLGKENAFEKILEGLQRLEYRGYDSWGMAFRVTVKGKNKIVHTKNVGKIGDLTSKNIGIYSQDIGIGHTRWATTGGVTKANAHPHFATDESFCLAHNGIVENYKELKDQLIKKGYKFESETDTEVIVRLLEEKLKKQKNKDLKEAIHHVFQDITGRNTIIILLRDEKEIIAARNGSPLVVGINEKNKDIYLSSDTLSFAPYAKKMIVLENNQLVDVTPNNVSLFDLVSGKKLTYKLERLDIKNVKVDKEGYDHFMLKEIHESPYVIKQVIIGAEPGSDFYHLISNINKMKGTLYTIGSGTAGIAAAQIAYYLRYYGEKKVINLIGGDATEHLKLFEGGHLDSAFNDILIAPSQSGETADVLEVLEFAKNKGAQIASYVNMPGSSMTRISDFKFMANAGPEICVMSTKIFVSQIAWGYLLGKSLKGGGDKNGKKNLDFLSKQMEKYLQNKDSLKQIKKVASLLKEKKDIFLMSKGQNLQIMNEGMVKIIEGTYKHAHAIPAGDLKHYAITLIEKGVPVIIALSNDNNKTDILNAVSEVKARGATIIAIGRKENKDNELFDEFIEVPDTGETSAIMNAIPLQLLAYYMTVALGNNVDKPRNIAKSVTVK